MIYDTVDNLHQYTGCIPHVMEIHEYLLHQSPARLADGPQVICGEEVVLKMNRYALPADVTPRYEAHRQYADLHVVFSGCEIIRTSFLPEVSRLTAYDANNDIEFFSAWVHSTEFVLTPGRFLYLAPGEIHRPGCVCPGQEGDVVKGVGKIAIRENSG